MATIDSITPILKTLYSRGYVEWATLKNRPGIGLFKKFEEFFGANLRIAIKHGNTMMRSHSFSNAQGTSLDSVWKGFLLTRVENHSLAHLSSHSVAASSSTTGALVKAMKDEMDSAYDALADSIETEFYRNQNGVLGVVGSVSTTDVTLSDINTVTNFELNMEVVTAETETGALQAGSATITGINRSTGVLTTDSNWTAQIAACDAGDYLFAQGDAPNGGSAVCIAGLDSWLPSTAPSASESFFGVDRSVDDRLYGTIHDGSKQLVGEALIDGASKAGQLHDGVVDVYLINHVQNRKLAKEKEVKKIDTQMSAMGGKGKIASISYSGFRVEGDHGPIDVIPANKCPSTTAYGLQRGLWTLASLGQLCRVDDTDGKDYLRRSSASGVESRHVSWSNLGCKSPGRNVRVTLAA